MGGQPSKKELVIATINYSGILLSPFEFYSKEYQSQEHELSKCFKSLLEKDPSFNKKQYKWGLGKIDTKLQVQRYTPIYRQKAGIQKGKLVNQDTFKERWNEEFFQHKNDFKDQKEVQNCRKFDLHCYRSIILYLYKVQDLSKAPTLNISKYQQFMKKYFSKSFLNEKNKIRQTFEAMQSENVDVLFLQEVSSDLISSFPQKNNFHVVLGTGCAILIRKNKFSKFHDSEKVLSFLETGLKGSINWNDDTVFAFVDNFLLIGMHLSSKKEKNSDQIKKMTEDLLKLAKAYPMCHIIAGGDANNFVDPSLLQKQFHSYPIEKNAITTMKKRTWIQPQVNKAEELAADVKDVLFSTIPFINPRIVTIFGVDSKKVSLIPNQEHPCDHFVVAANLQIYYH